MDVLIDRKRENEKTCTGVYLYCIVAKEQLPAGGFDFRGLEKKALKTINYRDLSAVVSDTSASQQRLTRENMILHTKVLEHILQFQQMLPVRFGVVSKSAQDVCTRLLEADYWNLREVLDGLKGKCELGVRLLWNHDDVLKRILESDAQIASLRNDLLEKNAESIHYQKINLGRMLEAAVREERERIRKRFMECLLPISVDSRQNKLVSDAMVMNAAFLVEAAREAEFSETLSKLDDEFAGALSIKYTAVAPPYNFVNITIKLWD